VDIEKKLYLELQRINATLVIWFHLWMPSLWWNSQMFVYNLGAIYLTIGGFVKCLNGIFHLE